MNTVEDALMPWERARRGQFVFNLGAYCGVVEQAKDGRAWTARVEAPDQVYQSVFDYPTMIEAQAWVEQQIEVLLRSPRSTS